MLIVTIRFGYVPDYVKTRLAARSAIDRLTSNQLAVLKYLGDHPYATLQETADECSLSLGGVKKITAKLQELDLLKREGAKNKTTWVVL